MLRKYNALFILPATLSDEDVEKAMQNVTEAIARLNGTASNVHVLGKHTFARPLKSHETGHYAKMQIDIEPGNIDALLAKLKLNEDVFRVQVLRDEEDSAPVADAEPNKEKDNG